jgi:hypothetical protein
LMFCSDSPPRLSHPTSDDHLPPAGIHSLRPCGVILCRVGQGRGSTTLACHSITSIAASVIAATAGPPAVITNTGGGPARGGVSLISESNLLRAGDSA